MRSERFRNGRYAVLATLVTLIAGPVVEAQLIGVEEATGNLYQISAVDASLTLIGGTGLDGVGALEFNPYDGLLYAMTTGENATLYQIDLSPSMDQVLSVDPIGELGIFAYEGGLAFGPDGTAYAVNGGTTVSALLTVDLDTGVATVVGILDGGGRRDIAGLGWRSDGVLVGIDSTTNTMLTIDPVTANPPSDPVITSYIEDSASIGSVGGMVMFGDAAYYATANQWAQTAGSNMLYTFNPFTGEQTGVGPFTLLDNNQFNGISGLAIIPEPATFGLVVIGCCAFLRRRKG